LLRSFEKRKERKKKRKSYYYDEPSKASQKEF
jgi:hypothetical protein